ncbi:uncharacterized protein [Epargyreus clarus]|uniref:uncharacterized protein n=1 Tax=Epargyreus clarus TaxID=520877 RepID=UPI003C2F4B58
MQKKLCFVLSLTLACYWAESKPVRVGTLEYDKLDTDIDDLKYEVEEEDLDDFSKLLEEADKTSKSDKSAKSEKLNTSVDATGSKKKNTDNKGVSIKTNIDDLKKFFKVFGGHDQGNYNDNDVYGLYKKAAGKAVGVTGKEDREYKKGTKTRGFHKVHHKDEYKKEKEFFEDDVTSGVIKKVGAKGTGFKVAGGVGFNKGHFHHDHTKGLYGKEGFSDNENIDKELKGYSDSQGFDSYFTKNK